MTQGLVDSPSAAQIPQQNPTVPRSHEKLGTQRPAPRAFLTSVLLDRHCDAPAGICDYPSASSRTLPVLIQGPQSGGLSAIVRLFEEDQH